MESKDLARILTGHVQRNKSEYSEFTNRMNVVISNILNNKNRDFEKSVAILEQVSPLKILSRGYSISYSDGKIVKSVDDIGSTIDIMVADGEVKMEVIKKEVNKR